MTAISTRAHEKFMELIHERAASEEMDPGFQADSKLLLQLYDRYHDHLSSLRRLVVQYEMVQRRLRTELRERSAVAT